MAVELAKLSIAIITEANCKEDYASGVMDIEKASSVLLFAMRTQNFIHTNIITFEAEL